MQASEKMQNVDQKAQEKRPYSQPELVRHGDMKDLTQVLPIGGHSAQMQNG